MPLAQVGQREPPAPVLLLGGGHRGERALRAREIVGIETAIGIAQRQPQRLIVERRALAGLEAALGAGARVQRAHLVQPRTQRLVAARRGQQLAVAQPHAEGRIVGMAGQPLLHQAQAVVGIAERDGLASHRGEHLRVRARGVGGLPQQGACIVRAAGGQGEAALAQQLLGAQVAAQFAHALGALGLGNGG